MAPSLAIAAPPLLALLCVLFLLHRYGGGSGLTLVVAVLWGGLGATGVVTLVNAGWVEQPLYYPYLITPVVEELAKAALLLVLILLGLVSGAPFGLAYGLASGLGFALWENAAYFEEYGQGGPPPWLYMARTAGAALLHGFSTAVVGAGGGLGGLKTSITRRSLLVGATFVLAVSVHVAWNYGCLVLADTSILRRVLPVAGAAMLLIIMALSVLREHHLLRAEVLNLWQEGILSESIAIPLTGKAPLPRLRRAGIKQPRRLLLAAFQLALVRRQLGGLESPRLRAHLRRRLSRLETKWTAMVQALVAGVKVPLDRTWTGQLALAAGLVALGLGLHQLGSVSPVPAALSRRTVVVASGLPLRPEPLITILGQDTYVLWQRGTATSSLREQVLTWVGPGQMGHRTSVLGQLPTDRDDWYDMAAVGEDEVVVGTRQGAAISLRSYSKGKRTGSLELEALEREEPTCWPWLVSDRGRALAAWDRLKKAAWLSSDPLEARQPFDLPDPFDNVDAGKQGCFRGLVLTDDIAYQVARPTGAALVAAVDLERGGATSLTLCDPVGKAPPPGGSLGFRVHSMDKDRDKVLVLLGREGTKGYELLLAHLDRAGKVEKQCRPLRAMPAGEPPVVALAGAGDNAFLAWSTNNYVLLTRIPLAPDGKSRERRWILDRAPRGRPAVVRLGVTKGRLFVAWEAGEPESGYSLKLLRTEISDLP